jgi:hypothetical protein
MSGLAVLLMAASAGGARGGTLLGPTSHVATVAADNVPGPGAWIPWLSAARASRYRAAGRGSNLRSVPDNDPGGALRLDVPAVRIRIRRIMEPDCG